MRAVEDYHVDRPGVEAPRGVKLTGTNRSIGLIASSTSSMSGNKARHTAKLIQECRIQSLHLPGGGIVQTFFADLVVLAEEFHPIPFRTRPLKPPAPMVLRLKTRESRSLPGLPRTFASRSARARRLKKIRRKTVPPSQTTKSPAREISRGFLLLRAGHREPCSIFS